MMTHTCGKELLLGWPRQYVGSSTDLSEVDDVGVRSAQT